MAQNKDTQNEDRDEMNASDTTRMSDRSSERKTTEGEAGEGARSEDEQEL